MSRPILPGATLGLFGSGQLGRMFALAARAMGYRVAVFSPEQNAPASVIADWSVVADYTDLDQVKQFAQKVDVITLEFENISTEAVGLAEQFVPVRPGTHPLHLTQHRVREKQALKDAGLPVTPFRPVSTLEECVAAWEEFGKQAVVKTACWGYDGKGQRKLTPQSDVAALWKELETDDAIVEQWIEYEAELSVVGVRGLDHQFCAYGPLWNRHSNHILDVTSVPGPFSHQIAEQSLEIVQQVMQVLEYVGVGCVEFFLTGQGDLMINEVAPRPHNSGHLTIEAHATSQFEQQVRAICGLPLGSTELLKPAAMVNLLGDLWEQGPPAWDQALAGMAPESSAHLHLYGKTEARMGRKMGHLTVLADSAELATEQAQMARDRVHF